MYSLLHKTTYYVSIRYTNVAQLLILIGIITLIGKEINDAIAVIEQERPDVTFFDSIFPKERWNSPYIDFGAFVPYFNIKIVRKRCMAFLCFVWITRIFMYIQLSVHKTTYYVSIHYTDFQKREKLRILIGKEINDAIEVIEQERPDVTFFEHKKNNNNGTALNKKGDKNWDQICFIRSSHVLDRNPKDTHHVLDRQQQQTLSGMAFLCFIWITRIFYWQQKGNMIVFS
ncbi:hypothetical protein ACJX0J_007961 [Zea mays]